jgi:short-subunit dehydrogenase
MAASGTWQSAVVTGASAGIGAAMARALAAQGTRHLLLVARRADRLESLAAELERVEGTRAEVVVGDLTRAADTQALAQRVAAEAPDLFVANAGAGRYGTFDALPIAPQLASIDLNVRALVELSHAYVRAARVRGRGALLLVASTAGCAPVPYEAVYAASKTFVLHFGEALHEELRGSGVEVRTLCPGFTETEFASVAGLPSDVVLQHGVRAEDVARTGLQAFRRRAPVVWHGRRTRLAGLLGRVAPRALVVRVVGRWMRRGLTERGAT